MTCLVRRTFNCHNNDYITAFHLAGRSAVDDSQLCTTDMDNGLCSLLNACHQVTVAYWHTDITNSLMFSLAPVLPMFDVRIGLTLLFIWVCLWTDTTVAHNTAQDSSNLTIFPAIITNLVCWIELDGIIQNVTLLGWWLQLKCTKIRRRFHTTWIYGTAV